MALLASRALAADLLTVADPPKPALRLARVGGGEGLAPPDGNGIVIVHFFATWCPPCVPELAALDRMARARPEIRVVAIDVGEVTARVARFLATRPVAFSVLLDPDRAAARAWDVAQLPASFVFDGSGALLRAAEGDVAWDAPAIRTELDQLTKPAPPNGAPDGENQDEPT